MAIESALLDLPPAVLKLYDAWQEQHQRDGRIPGYAERRDQNGVERWCDISKADREVLHQVEIHQRQAAERVFRSLPACCSPRRGPGRRLGRR
jgi:hypothetical protein